MPFIVTAVTAIAGAISGVLAAGGIGAALLRIGGTLLLSYAAQALMPKPQTTMQPRTVTIREPVVPRDLVYGRTTETGFLWALGVVSTLPTATEDTLGADRWNLGPEILIGKSIDKVVLGALAGYQTDIGGSGDADVSLTTISAWFTYLPGGGWNVSTAPIMSYDHENSQWTLPLNLTVGKTVIWNGRPWKLSAEVNYFVDQPDAFGPEWMFGINIAPVVENLFARMFH